MHLDVRVDCGHLSRGFDAGCSSTADYYMTVACLYGRKCFTQRCCGQRTARCEGISILRYARHSLAISRTPQSIDQVIILQMVRLLLICDNNFMLCRVDTGDSSLNKLDMRSTQHLKESAIGLPDSWQTDVSAGAR